MKTSEVFISQCVVSSYDVLLFFIFECVRAEAALHVSVAVCKEKIV